MYNNAIPYRIFIAVLLVIAAFLLLVISDDNVRTVMEINKSAKINNFPKARMFIGNVVIVFTMFSILFDNFNVLNMLEEVQGFRGPIIIIAIWIIG